jgi:hypothetical protein
MALMKETANISETSANVYQITWSNNPEDSHLHTRRRDNLNSQLTSMYFQQPKLKYVDVMFKRVLKSANITIKKQA